MKLMLLLTLLLQSAAIAGTLRDVTAHGAMPDDARDDTVAIQSAVEASEAGDTIFFPRGVYRVVTVRLKPGRRYEGAEGAVILRHGRQDKWTRTFTTEGEGYEHRGDEDSAPLVITGLTFDGNRGEQGAYRGYEMEQAHLVFLNADARKKGRLRAEVTRCLFRDCVADGLSIHVNVDAVVDGCRAWDCFRGGVVLTGGHSRLFLRDFEAGGDDHDTGIDIEVDGRGHSGTFRIEARLEDLRLQGDFDIAVSDRSRVEAHRVRSGAPFYLYAKNSSVFLNECRFEIGAADGYENRVVMPGEVRFESCVLTTVPRNTGGPADSHGLEVYWEIGDDRPPRQQLTFSRTGFQLGAGFKEKDRPHALKSNHCSKRSKHELLLEACSLDPAFATPLVVEDGGVPVRQTGTRNPR
jgi:hypothetical protein